MFAFVESATDDREEPRELSEMSRVPNSAVAGM